MVRTSCDHKIKCCWIQYCHLEVAFGRTIHTFQGQECGPGKPIESIIVNPGNRGFETLNPGTLNCCVSRASTIGSGDISKSALFLNGPHINKERFQDMIISTTGHKYIKVLERDVWISFLETKTKETMMELQSVDEFQFNKLEKDITSFSLICHDIDKVIQYHFLN